MSNASVEAEGRFTAGSRHIAAGDFAAAEACFNEALALLPDFAEALANLGWLREQDGAIAEAEACYWRALALRPDLLQPYINLGILLWRARRFADAEVVYRQALVQAPASAAAWSHLGVLYACMKREAEAERCYRTALACDPAYRHASFNLAYVLLRQGRFEEGWECLDARDWYGALAKHFTCPRWQGEALAGRSVIIGFEAGHGDMIQFCRYASVLKRMGASRISMICHPALKTLFASLKDVDELFSFDEAVPASGWDFWTPPLSIPRWCGTRLDTIPAEIPYLAADEQHVAKWLPRLPQGMPRVGLVWKGSARFENDAERSLPSLATLAPLAAVSGVRFVSLQKGSGDEEALSSPAGLSLLPLGSDFTDFADTAAVVAHLDLVISVDTAVAHLAGALGTPCWLLLPDYSTDWRWLAEGSESPWYPGTMRLWRQAPGGDWPAVVADVATALERRIAGSRR
jgi:tetratricopeptide (TPR) repeat protein